MTDDYAGLARTHSGVVIFLGDLAYKVKRPVRLGFLDFTTLQARRAVCEREVELNRQFAPDVYLGVGALRRPDGEEEPAVVLRRMPAERRLTGLVRADPDAPRVVDALTRVARLMARFHATARRGPAIDAEGTRDAILARWDASFAQVHDHGVEAIGADLLAEIEDRVHGFLAGREALFAARIADGHVVDGHADLIADDVFCLDDGPRILDCLEFDDRLRFVDVLDDMAFLAMDLEWLGAPGLADHLLRTYLELTGDPAPDALLHHFIAYRAFVRAKVSGLQGADLHVGGTAQAAGYARLAATHLRAGEVRLVLVGGPPGTGKTTLAGGLADRLGCTVLSSDRVRKELAGIAGETSARAELDRGIYAPTHTRATYAELLRRAGALLALGESVVLDASWTDPDRRREAAALAEAASSRLVPLRCRLAPQTAAERVAARGGAGISDADAVVARALQARAQTWPGSVPVDTSGPRAHSLDQALSAVVGDQSSAASA